MIKNFNETSPAMDRALKNLEQAKARYEAERRKQNEKRRKAENHHKYMMGGIIVKYFPECYQYEQNELEGILRAALSSPQFQKAMELVQKINAQEYDDMPDKEKPAESRDSYENRWNNKRENNSYTGYTEGAGGGYGGAEEHDAREDSYGEDR